METYVKMTLDEFEELKAFKDAAEQNLIAVKGVFKEPRDIRGNIITVGYRSSMFIFSKDEVVKALSEKIEILEKQIKNLDTP